MAEFVSFDEFMTADLGGDSSTRKKTGYLKSWRKGRGEQKITVWLHTRANFADTWAHQFPRYREDGSKLRVQSFGTWNCHETNKEVLKKAKYRDEDGHREYPPERCPMDLAIDWVHAMIVAEKLDMYAPIFRFVDDEDDQNNVTILAGEFAGVFASKFNPLTNDEWSESDKKIMQKHGINLRDAYKTSPMAQNKFIFCVVVKGQEDEGCLIAKEAPSLGVKMQKKCQEMIRVFGSEKGNPLRNPYPFEWSFDDSKQFDKKYDVLALPTENTPPEIMAILTEEDPPNIKPQFKPFKPSLLRWTMEKAAVIKMPFDSFFKHVVDEEETEEFDPEKYEEEKKSTKRAEEPKQPASATKSKKVEVEYYVCNHCEYDKLVESDRECPKCGARYDADGEMTARPCASCKSITECEDGQADAGVCKACGAVHELETWKILVQPKAEPAKKSLRRKAVSVAQDDLDQIPYAK